MRTETNYVLSIAGFDPSAGAGILADIKTIEANGVYGLGVCSALTFQNDIEFEKVDWIPVEKIISQIKILQKRFDFKIVKIGLIENLEVLEKIISYCELSIANCQLIWDPILKASVGFVFHKNIEQKKLDGVCKKLFLITPNLEEINIFFPDKTEMEGAEYLSQFCSVLLKGGHSNNEDANDILFDRGEQIIFEGKKIKNKKHGSGCVLSSAIAANLAKENDLETACREGKKYVMKFLESSESLLGFHNNLAIQSKMISSFQFITHNSELAYMACQGGADWIQLRIKNKSDDDWKKIAREVQQVCKKYSATFILNDNVFLAKEIQADGVHLGKEDKNPIEARKILGDEFIIGGTANTLDDVKKLMDAKVDYIGLGPFRFTETKKNLSPVLGNEEIKKIVGAKNFLPLQIPIIAIGGIQLEDVDELMQTGIYGVAVSSAINSVGDKIEMTKKFLEKIKNHSPLRHKEHKATQITL